MSAVADTSGSGAAAPTAQRPAAALLLPVLAIVVVDQVTKAWAVHALADHDIRILGDRVGFTLTRNSGSAFSLFQNATPLLAVLAIVVAVVLWRVARRASDRWLVAGLTLVLGGALGNLIDRFFRAPGPLRGHVVDFVHVWPIPVFNVADACITVGASLLVVRTLLVPESVPQS